MQAKWSQVLEELVEAWEEVPVRLIDQISSYSADHYVRAMGAVALATAAKHQPYLIDKVLRMAQDPEWIVRKTMCRGLVKLVPLTSQDKLVPEILKLARDDTVHVLDSGLPVLFGVLHLLSPEKLKEVKTTLLKDIFETKKTNFVKVYLNHMGEFLRRFKEVLEKDEVQKCLEWASKHLEDQETKELVVESIPSFLEALGTVNSLLWKIILSAEKKSERLTKQLCQICLASSNYKEHLQEKLKTNLKDQNSRHLVLKNSAKASVQLGNQTEVLEILLEILKGSKLWRQQVVILEEVTQLVDQVDQPQKLTECFFALLGVVQSSVCKVREACCQVSAKVFQVVYQQKQELADFLIRNFAESPVYRDRMAYLDFCVEVKKHISRKMFNQYFMEALIKLGQDPCLDVNIKFAKLIPTFKFFTLEKDQDSRRTLRRFLHNFLEKDSKTLIEYSIEAENTLPEEWEKAYGAEAQEREELLESQEAMQEQRQKLEEENLKENLKQELIDKAKEKYKNLKPKRLTMSFRQSTYRPTPKRKSASDADKHENSRVLRRYHTYKK